MMLLMFPNLFIIAKARLSPFLGGGAGIGFSSRAALSFCAALIRRSISSSSSSSSWISGPPSVVKLALSTTLLAGALLLAATGLATAADGFAVDVGFAAVPPKNAATREAFSF